MNNFKFDKKTKELIEVILSLKTVKEAEAFFRDLCTIEEIKSMSDRWQIVKMVDQGRSYRKIAQALNTSTTTVVRVALWLKNGRGGYKLALDKNKSHHHKPPLVRKEV